MNDEQAGEIVTLIRAAVADTRVNDQTIDYFRVALTNLDYDLALSAATMGTVTWRRFPSWAEFKESYRAQKRISEPEVEQRPKYPEKPPKHPEWVHVWGWCRMARTPRNLRAFPQQQPHVDPSTIMSMEEYEQLKNEWIEAGSPKYENPIPMAR